MKRPLAPAPAHTFAPGAGTLNLSGISGFDINRLAAVIDTTANNQFIYLEGGGPALGYSALSGTTLTLQASMTGLNANDNLIVIYDDGGKVAEDGVDTAGSTMPAGGAGIRGWLSALFGTFGTTADAAWTGSGAATVVALLKALWTQGAVTDPVATQPFNGGSAVTTSNRLPVDVGSPAVTVSGVATSANQTTEITTLGSILTTLQGQRAESLWTDDTGAYFVRVDRAGTITWTDLSGTAASAPGTGARPAAGTTVLLDRSPFQAIASGTGYSTSDYLDHFITTDPGSGAVIGNFWINASTGLKLASAPASANITPVAGTPTGGALDSTLTGGSQKAIARGGAKGTTTSADVTSTASGANHQALDVAIYDTAGNQVTSFGSTAVYSAAAPTLTDGQSSSLRLSTSGQLLISGPGPSAATSGLTSIRVVAAASTNSTSLKATAGNIGNIDLFNVAAYDVFLKFYNKASAPLVGASYAGGATTSGSATITMTSTTGLSAGQQITNTGVPAGATILSVTNGTTAVMSANATATGSSLTFAVSDTPVWTIPLKAGTGYSRSFPQGKFFAAGIAYALTKLQADTDATALAAGDVTGSIDWI